MLYLNESMRQRDDLLFDSILRKIRLGIVDKSVARQLIRNIRLKPYEIPKKLDAGKLLPTILVGTNKAASEMNKLHYNKLTTQEYDITGNFIWRNRHNMIIKMETQQAKRVFYLLHYFMIYFDYCYI